MTQSSLRFGVDINHDGFFARNLDSSDAVSMLVYGASQKDMPISDFFSEVTVNDKQRSFPYGTVYYRCVTETGASAGFYFGYDGSQSYILCRPLTQYTISFWYRGIDNYDGDSLVWIATDGTNSTGSQTDAFSADWTQASASFTTAAGETSMLILFDHDANSVMTYDIAGVMVVPGTTAPDAFSAGHYSDIHEDITSYVGTANWTNGVQAAYETVAGESRLTLTLDDPANHWDFDYQGSEELTNGSFEDWSGGFPDGWFPTSVLNTLTISEVGTGEGYGGTGTDAINFAVPALDDGAIGLLRQIAGPLAIGKRYKVTYTISYIDAISPTTFLSGYLLFINDDNFITSKLMALGTYEFYFTAKSTGFGLYVNLPAAPFDDMNFTLDSISVVEVARYAGVSKGTMVWIESPFSNSILPLYVGYIESIQPSIGLYNTPAVTIEAIDAMPVLMRTEYAPAFATNQRVDTVLLDILTRSGFAWPYLSEYWFLGVQGGSWLGEETFLYDAQDLTQFEAADTTLDFVGDIVTGSDLAISSQNAIRDLMAAEMFGRFYFDTRGGYFRFINRNYDATIISPALSLTDDDFDGGDVRYADDLINSVKVYFNQRELSVEEAVLWQSSNDVTVRPGETKTVIGRYRDADNESVQVAAFETIPLDPGGDYTVTPTDLFTRGKIMISVDAGAQSATFQLTSTALERTATVSNLRIRGFQLKKFDRQLVEASNAYSIFRHDKQEQTYNVPLISEFDDVQNYALTLVNLYSKPTVRFASLTWNANKDSTRMQRAQNNYLNQMIHIATTEGHDADYHVVGERHDVSAGGEDTWNVTWILKPDDRITYWYLGEVGRSELGQTTTLAF